jgi:hypothetical protein
MNSMYVILGQQKDCKKVKLMLVIFALDITGHRNLFLELQITVKVLMFGR